VESATCSQQPWLFPANFQGITQRDAESYIGMFYEGQAVSSADVAATLQEMGLVQDATASAWVLPNGIDENGKLTGDIWSGMIESSPPPPTDQILQLNLPSRNWLDYMPKLPEMITYTDYGGGGGGGGGSSSSAKGNELWIAMSMRASGG